ncbi:HK97 gp10 family phage protein [Vagococcus carniphilus]|uniref:HK97-gp10 family putative phage morphogenesis protein n=1 Tax=Vagococcus carniphilus TaxID=218144 RepID=UPI00288F6EA0|nr:HK97-gp10 family putative phage morphogenesis protein [Vagococcus carniphilus]MDT2850177.1 HK97 gp10 family phage protein [Vagococcus carniphilus]
MSKNNNGFEEMADYLGNLSKVTVDVSKKSLEEAAEFYVKKLIPEIPRSLKNRKHMRDQVKVTIERDKVVVHFEDTAFYWRFVENGTETIRAVHFASGTYEANKQEIERIMTNKILKEMS